jgi:hypothetical protein
MNENLKEKTSEYKNIFKSTFFFGFVQVFNILIKIVLNKVAAIYFGRVQNLSDKNFKREEY